MSNNMNADISAPERIWHDYDEAYPDKLGFSHKDKTALVGPTVEYVRADLYEAQAKRIADLEAIRLLSNITTVNAYAVRDQRITELEADGLRMRKALGLKPNSKLPKSYTSTHDRNI